MRHTDTDTDTDRVRHRPKQPSVYGPILYTTRSPTGPAPDAVPLPQRKQRHRHTRSTKFKRRLSYVPTPLSYLPTYRRQHTVRTVSAARLAPTLGPV